jgi:hypothetical protein
VPDEERREKTRSQILFVAALRVLRHLARTEGAGRGQPLDML